MIRTVFNQAIKSGYIDSGFYPYNKLTMHLVRHTFGALSGDRIPIQLLQKLYLHSNITTTINYQQAFIYKDADDALDAVLNQS